MHWSISKFDYIILQVSNTKNIVDKVNKINNMFQNLSEDNDYPFIVSVSDTEFEEIYEKNIYNDIMSIIAHNNGVIEENFISLCLIDEHIDDQYQNQQSKSRFTLGNISEIISIIGSNGEFSFSDKLNMFDLNELKFYENDGFIVLVASF